MKLLLLLGCAVMLTACEEPVMCTASIEPSVLVEIRDSVTSAPAASGATLLVRNAGGGDAAAGAGVGDLYLQWGAEQAGTFDVTVQKPGYADWHRDDVVVSPGRCHVQTARLLARLRPMQ